MVPWPQLRVQDILYRHAGTMINWPDMKMHNTKVPTFQESFSFIQMPAADNTYKKTCIEQPLTTKE